MPSPANLVHEISASTGLGNFTLTAQNGKQRFSTAFGTGVTLNVFDYFISNQDVAEWERGTGHMSAVGTLVRDTVLESTNANAAVNFSAGTKNVTNDVPALKQVTTEGVSQASAASLIVQRDANQNAFANSFTSKGTNVTSAGGTTTLTAASTRVQNLQGTQNQIFQLPDATTLTVSAQFQFNNNSTGVLTVNDGSGALVGTIPAGGMALVSLMVNVVLAGVWDLHASLASNGSWGTAGATVNGWLLSAPTNEFNFQNFR